MYDLIIKDATTLSGHGRLVADVAILNGRISYVGPRPRHPAKRTLSAMGKFLLPGLVDTFRDAGDTPWSEASRSALASGVTSAVLVPDSPISDVMSAEQVSKRLLAASWVHLGLWAAATEARPADLVGALQGGHIIGALAPASLATQREALAELLAADLPLAFVLDNERAHLDALLAAAAPSQRALHLLQVSSSAEILRLDPVKIPPSVSTGVSLPHLFLSTEQDVVWSGPALRTEEDRHSVWSGLKRGRLHAIASGAAEGADALLPLLLGAVHAGRLTLEQVVDLSAEAPARLLGLSKKGRIEVGADADLVLIDEPRGGPVDSEDPSPYANREREAPPAMVFLAGELVAEDGVAISSRPDSRILER